MSYSEVLEQFVKNAERKESEDPNYIKKTKDKLEKNPRWDSQTDEIIKSLIRTKPEMAKGMEYKNNILEIAHKDKVVVLDTYDKLNGLVENNIERQNILLNIIMRAPRGQVVHEKYADLKKSLEKTLRYSISSNNKELEGFTKKCIEQLNTKLHKKALAPAVWIISGIIGALYSHQHLPNVDNGFKVNHERLISSLDDFEKSSGGQIYGVEYKPQFLDMVRDFKNKILEFNALYEQFTPLVDKIEKPQTAQELMELQSRPDGSELATAFDTITKAVTNFIPYINRIYTNFSSQDFKSRMINQKGFLNEIIDHTSVLHGGKGLIADDFDDVVNALGAYKNSLLSISNIFSASKNEAISAKNQLEQAMSETQRAQSVSEKDNSNDQKINDIAKELGIEL